MVRITKVSKLLLGANFLQSFFSLLFHTRRVTYEWKRVCGELWGEKNVQGKKNVVEKEGVEAGGVSSVRTEHIINGKC